MAWFMSCLKWAKRFGIRYFGINDLTDTVNVFSKIVVFWILFLVITIIVLQNFADSNDMSGFYSVGPNDQLIILGCTIDTGGKYFGVIVYTSINSVVRTLNDEVLYAWMINYIYDGSKDLKKIDRIRAYQVSSILTTYKWLDFFVYMNILFSQIDMLVIEIMSELVVNYFSTTFFLNAHEFFEDNEQLKETEMNALHNNAPFNGIQRISVMPGAVVTQGSVTSGSDSTKGPVKEDAVTVHKEKIFDRPIKRCSVLARSGPGVI